MYVRVAIELTTDLQSNICYSKTYCLCMMNRVVLNIEHRRSIFTVSKSLKSVWIFLSSYTASDIP